MPRAIREYREALRLEPGAADVHNNLGGLLAEGGNLAGARAEFEEALRLKPDYAEARANLGARAGRWRARRAPDDEDAARVLIIAALSAWIYSPCIQGTWLWDDGLEVAQNAALREPGGWWRPWVHPQGMDYFPLKSSLQWVEWHLWGANPPATTW